MHNRSRGASLFKESTNSVMVSATLKVLCWWVCFPTININYLASNVNTVVTLIQLSHEYSILPEIITLSVDDVLLSTACNAHEGNTIKSQVF